MSKIKVNDLIKDFRRMAEEHWAYEAGAAWVLTAEFGKAIKQGDEKAKQRYGGNDEHDEYDSN